MERICKTVDGTIYIKTMVLTVYIAKFTNPPCSKCPRAETTIGLHFAAHTYLVESHVYHQT